MYIYTMRNLPEYQIKYSISRRVSRIAGFMGKIPIPQFLRSTVYGMYATFYGVKIEDMEKPFQTYKNFSEFFTRTVKPRPLDSEEHHFVSPCDAKILTVSELNPQFNETIKGRHYHLGELLTGI